MAELQLAGSTAVVVAAGGEIASATAVRLTKEGAKVVLIGNNAGESARASSAVSAAGGSAIRLQTDLLHWDSMAAAALQCADLSYPVRVLVNCHLAIEWGTIEAMDIPTWERDLRVNFLGPLIATKAFLPLLKKHGGSVVHIGSVDGTFGNPIAPAYSAARGALVPLTHMMAHEFAGYGIRVNCIARAGVPDSGATLADDGLIDAYVGVTPLRRRGTPAEVASVVAFFATDESSYVTGSVLIVDGGRTGLTPGTTGHTPDPSFGRIP